MARRSVVTIDQFGFLRVFVLPSLRIIQTIEPSQHFKNSKVVDMTTVPPIVSDNAKLNNRMLVVISEDCMVSE
tara:strand:+ start:939 stop:1157 length:219 start_codon:yes stop_codon:yes gene_type:complete